MGRPAAILAYRDGDRLLRLVTDNSRSLTLGRMSFTGVVGSAERFRSAKLRLTVRNLGAYSPSISFDRKPTNYVWPPRGREVQKDHADANRRVLSKVVHPLYVLFQLADPVLYRSASESAPRQL